MLKTFIDDHSINIKIILLTALVHYSAKDMIFYVTTSQLKIDRQGMCSEHNFCLIWNLHGHLHMSRILQGFQYYNLEFIPNSV